jgi:hypothetical protein
MMRGFYSPLVAAVFLAGLLFPVPSVADFTVVALPDTQNYSEYYPEIYDAQAQWVVDNQDFRNIGFVTHLGDIVNNAATQFEWNNAEQSMAILDDADVPYGTCVGNHDVLYPGDYYDPSGQNYLSKFDPDYYAGKPWFGGASPSGLSNYQVISVDGREFLFLHLLVETPPEELAWAQGILNANQDKLTWVSTHRYLFDWSILGAGRYDDFNYTFEPLYRHDGISADSFFHNFVAANRQIYVIHCGHNHAEYRQASTNQFGLTVHELLADYQDDPNGGNGWLRIYTLRPDADRIDAESYSPYLGQCRTGEENEFSLAVSFDDYVTGTPFLTFQQGVGGYAGMRDTWINEDEPSKSYGTSDIVIVDNDTANNIFTDYEAQGLFAFDDLFQNPVKEGDPAPTRIPYGATIASATMNLTLEDDTDICHPDFYVYRLTRSWNESSTWSSLGSGISIGSETDPDRVATFPGDNVSDNDYGRFFDVTDSVQAWSNGAANHGFVVYSEDVSLCDDGIAIHSSEHGSSAERPKLTVAFSYDVANGSPGITESLTATPSAIAEGETSELVFAAADPNPLDPLVFQLNGEEIHYATGAGSASHTILFEDDGVYAYTAEVKDDEATVPAGDVVVTVSNADPIIVELTGSLTLDVGRAFAFYAVASDPGTYDTIAASWDLDEDGEYDDYSGFEGWTWFDTPGIREVAVLVTDDDGGETIGVFDVDVQDLAADGDFDIDGESVDRDAHVFIDADDQAAFEFCAAGPDQTPAPPAPYAPENCLSAFDTDSDGDVDEQDRTSLLAIDET